MMSQIVNFIQIPNILGFWKWVENRILNTAIPIIFSLWKITKMNTKYLKISDTSWQHCLGRWVDQGQQGWDILIELLEGVVIDEGLQVLDYETQLGARVWGNVLKMCTLCHKIPNIFILLTNLKIFKVMAIILNVAQIWLKTGQQSSAWCCSGSKLLKTTGVS